MNFELYITLAAAALLVGSNYVDVTSLLGGLKGRQTDQGVSDAALAHQVKLLRYHFALCKACDREEGMKNLDNIDELLEHKEDGQ